tara:strand:+ start:1455 stop:2210 length:756 start_codon:yes stop_codon:yes gene_type:complete
MTNAIIQARMNSTRLPGKTMMDIEGLPLLQHVVNRTDKSKEIDKCIVATTSNQSDDVIIDYCTENEINYFRGSEENVLSRFYNCAKEYKTDIVVRVTADDPFIDYQLIDFSVKKLKNNKKLDYVSNTIKPTYPFGLDIESFKFSALKKAYNEAELESDKEHVTPYIWRNDKIFNLHNFLNDIDHSHLRWTIDEEEDLNFAREIFNQLYKSNRFFLMNDIIELTKKKEWINDLLLNTNRDEAYNKQIQKESK